MTKTININFNTLGYLCVGLLSLLAIVIINPSTTHSVHATCATGDTSQGCISAQASVEAEVTIGTSIAIAMDDKIMMDVTPSSTGATSVASTKVQVATNSIDGYALFMKADEALTNTSTMNDNSATNSINNTATSATLEDFAENTYGYNLSSNIADDSTIYSPVDTTGTTAIKKANSTGSLGSNNTNYGYGDEYYLNLGVKVGTDLPAGIYSGTITLSAVANPVTVRSMAGLKYMQDMTTDICTNTVTEYTKQLTDTRDGKKYWVAKLADGNCWMTQNLALDLSTEKTLTPGDTDLADGKTYTPSTNTVLYGAQISNRFTWATVEKESISYSAAKILRSLPNETSSNNPQCSSWIEPSELLTNCNDLFLDVSGPDWQPTFQVQPGKLHDKQYNAITVNEQDKTYDAHYLIGNYYSWPAATLTKSGDIDTNETATSSVCPSNWKLPSSNYDTTSHTLSGSFYQLLLAYGYPSSDSYTIDPQNNFVYTTISENNNQELTTAPFYFTRTGDLFSRSITDDYRLGYEFSSVPSNVFLWTSSVSDDSAANHIAFAIDSAFIYQKTSFRFHTLMPVRCLAR